MSGPTDGMRAVLDRLAAEDAGLGDPTLLDPQSGRALAALTNLRWNADLPEVAEARTVMHAGLPARLVVPENDGGAEAILHVHGGGWAFCSAATHEGAARRLALACGCPVLTGEEHQQRDHQRVDRGGLDHREPDEERAAQRPGGLGLAGDGVHRGGDRPALGQGRPQRAEADRDRGREDRDDFDEISGHGDVSSCISEEGAGRAGGSPTAAPMKTVARMAKI